MTWRALVGTVGVALATMVGVVAGQQAYEPERTAVTVQDSQRWSVPEVDWESHQPAARQWPEHADDYTASAAELIDHADHLDFSRIPEATRVELEAELRRRATLADELWRSYGGLLGAQDVSQRPPLIAQMDVFELAYVLLAVRADELAVQLHASGGAAPADGSAEHDLVRVSVREGCVEVRLAGDRYGRAWLAPVGAEQSQDRAERVLRRVTVTSSQASETKSGRCPGDRLVLSRHAEQVLRG